MPNTQKNNLAYDYSVYEEANKKVREPKIQVRENTKAKKGKPLTVLSMLQYLLVVLAIMPAILFGNIESDKLFKEETELKAQLAALQRDNESLLTEFESKTSLKRVEDYAEKVLGLVKLDKAQIEYFEVKSDNVIEIIEEDSNIFEKIKDWFLDILEYLDL